MIAFQYDDAFSFSEGLARVKTNGKYGFIGKDGQVRIRLQYDFSGEYYNGVAEVEIRDKWGLIDKEGNIIIPIKYDDIDLQNGEAALGLRL